MPAMPHMSGRHFFERGPAGRTVREPPEPQLEHHEAPQAMTMIAQAGPMLAPERRDRTVVEDAAVISDFVANGNGNGNGAHDFETVSGSAEVVETVEPEADEEAEIVRSSSSGG